MVEQLRLVGLCLLVVAIYKEVEDILYKEIVQIGDEIEMDRLACFLSMPITRFGLELVEETMFSMVLGDSIVKFFDYLQRIEKWNVKPYPVPLVAKDSSV